MMTRRLTIEARDAGAGELRDTASRRDRPVERMSDARVASPRGTSGGGPDDGRDSEFVV